MERRAIRSDHISHMTCTVHILTPRSKSRRRRDEKIPWSAAVQEPRFYQDVRESQCAACTRTRGPASRSARSGRDVGVNMGKPFKVPRSRLNLTSSSRRPYTGKELARELVSNA